MFNEKIAGFIFKKNFPNVKILSCIKYKNGYVFSYSLDDSPTMGNAVFVNGDTKKIEGFPFNLQRDPEFMRASFQNEIDISELW